MFPQIRPIKQRWNYREGDSSDAWCRLAKHVYTNLIVASHTELVVTDIRPLTILVADEHPVVREGLMAVINRQSDTSSLGFLLNSNGVFVVVFATYPDTHSASNVQLWHAITNTDLIFSVRRVKVLA